MNNVKAEGLKNGSLFMNTVAATVIKQLAGVVSGFVFSVACIEGLSPFGAALCACIFPEYIPACVLGTAFGYFYSYDVTILTLRYVGASVLAGLISYLLKRVISKKYALVTASVSAFIAVLSTGLILSIAVTVTADEFILYFTEGLISGAGAFFTGRFLSVAPVKRSAGRLTTTETASVLVVFALILLALGNFSIFSVSLCITAGVYAVLVAAAYGSDRYSSLLGIVASAMTAIIMPGSFIVGSVALGGLLAGIFGRKNKLFTALIFAITVSASAFASDDWISAVYVLAGVGTGISLFVFTPKPLGDFYRRVFAVSSRDAYIDGQRNVLKMRLRAAEDGMDKVTAAIRAIAGIYRRRGVPSEDKIYSNVSSAVCESCKNREHCWDRNYKSTSGLLRSIAEELRHSDASEQECISEKYLSACINPQKIMRALTSELERYRWAMRENAKTGETVNIVSDQFSAVSQLLSALADNMDCGEELDSEKTGIIADMLKNEFGEQILGAGVFTDENKKLCCEINIAAGRKIPERAIITAASETLGVPLGNAVVSSLPDGSSRIAVCEQTRLSVETGGYQISSDGGIWCGDSFDSFPDGKGNYYLILSDGMGTGKRAAADSVMCSSLASLLLRSGYPVDCILKMINSAMLVRSGEESLATLDIVRINLYTGEAVFYKAGATHSLALRHRRLLKIAKPSMPVGILGDIKFETVEMSFAEGDFIILMSDGVEEDIFPKWKSILSEAADFSGKELSDRLAKTAHMNTDEKDDITVFVAKIGKQ